MVRNTHAVAASSQIQSGVARWASGVSAASVSTYYKFNASVVTGIAGVGLAPEWLYDQVFAPDPGVRRDYVSMNQAWERGDTDAAAISASQLIGTYSGLIGLGAGALEAGGARVPYRVSFPEQPPVLPPSQTLMSGGSFEAQVSLAVERIPGLTAEQARVIFEGAFEKNSTVVIGGSRVRGNHTPASDLDVGFGGLTTKQAQNLIKAATKQGPLQLEKTQIIPGNETDFIQQIASPEEFFQRSGSRSGRDSAAGKPYGPSGSYSFSPSGSASYMPPGPGPVVPTARWVPWTAAALQGSVNQ